MQLYGVPDWNQNRIRTAVLFGIGTAGTTGITKTAVIGTAGTAKTTKTVGIGTTGTSIKKAGIAHA